MRVSRALIGSGAVALLLAGTWVPASAAPAAAVAAAAPLAPGVTAFYEMNEPFGTTVMHDSGPHGLDAVVDPAGVISGIEAAGAVGYTWEHRDPEAYPASPERVIQVPDNANLEPGSGPLTIELRYRSGEHFGNIAQKGQAQTTGGQWKIQSPGGIPSCLFKGSGGQVATGALTPLNDEQWHNLTCVLTSTGVTMYVDGEFRNRKNGPTGTIDNAMPMTVGGKIDCDQVDVTCDYFSGQIDYLKLTKAANLLPTGAYTPSCHGLTCSFDSSASADGDGSLTRYLWDFGDGQTSTQASPSHTYATPGAYNVRLTVTDNQAATDRENQTVTVEEAPPIESPIAYVASAASAGNNIAPTVAVPAAAQVGDRLLMVLSYNEPSRTVSPPTGVTGWTQIDGVLADTMGTVAWTKLVQPGEAGASVTVPLSAKAKFTLTVAAYRGTDPAAGVAYARATDVTPSSSRRTPTVTVAEGDWVASYWADKSATTVAWTPSTDVTTRRTACAADGGRICSALADSAIGLPAGSYGNVEATTNAPSDKATMWSFVLKPASGPPVNQPPTAAFSADCTLLDCAFDASASTDGDGSIASYAWDFGDGDTSTASAPTHAYAAAGPYDVELTVTDDDGDSDSLTIPVVAEEPPVESQVAHVGSASAQANNATPKITVPAAAAVGDRLVLALSINNATRTVSTPTGVAGWTQLDNVAADDLRTVLWTKVVQAGDAGTQLTVPMSGSAKYTVSVAAYSGVDQTASLPFASAVDTVNHAARQAPGVTAPAGSWVVSYWADKSSTTTLWTADGATTGRQMVCGADAGRVCSLLADSGQVVPAGPRAGAVATTNASSTKATAWSIVLPPAP